MSQPKVGVANQHDITRVGDDKLSPPTYCPDYLQCRYRVGFRGVGANSQNAGGLTDIVDGVGHRPTTEGCGQTGHSGGMSEPGTVVNIVGAQYRPAQFLGNVVILVGALG